jgi:hypothetical protein
MPTHKQDTVKSSKVTTRGLGAADTTNAILAYPGSPIHSGELTEEIVRAQGQDLVDGITSDGGHTFGSFDMDYSDAPDFADVEVGGGGLPGAPFAPNIASPGEGMNPADIPAVGVEATEAARGAGSPFPGDGLASPSKASKSVSRQKLGSLIFGNSDGTE